MARVLGDRQGEGLTLANMGLLYEERGDQEEACALWKEALSILIRRPIGRCRDG